MHKAGYPAAVPAPAPRPCCSPADSEQGTPKLFHLADISNLFFRATAGVASAASPQTADLTPSRSALSVSLSLSVCALPS